MRGRPTPRRLSLGAALMGPHRDGGTSPQRRRRCEREDGGGGLHNVTLAVPDQGLGYVRSGVEQRDDVRLPPQRTLMEVLPPRPLAFTSAPSVRKVPTISMAPSGRAPMRGVGALVSLASRPSSGEEVFTVICRRSSAACIRAVGGGNSRLPEYPTLGPHRVHILVRPYHAATWCRPAAKSLAFLSAPRLSKVRTTAGLLFITASIQPCLTAVILPLHRLRPPLRSDSEAVTAFCCSDKAVTPELFWC